MGNDRLQMKVQVRYTFASGSLPSMEQERTYNGFITVLKRRLKGERILIYPTSEKTRTKGRQINQITLINPFPLILGPKQVPTKSLANPM